MKVSYSQTDQENDLIEVISMGRAIPKKKTLFVVSFSARKIRIYINGVLDTIFEYPSLISQSSNNSNPLFILGHPSYLLSCKGIHSIFKFEIFERELSEKEVWGMAEGFTGIVEPGYITLGCESCNMHKVNLFYFIYQSIYNFYISF